jgi:hypothetical protein
MYYAYYCSALSSTLIIVTVTLDVDILHQSNRSPRRHSVLDKVITFPIQTELYVAITNAERIFGILFKSESLTGYRTKSSTCCQIATLV